MRLPTPSPYSTGEDWVLAGVQRGAAVAGPRLAASFSFFF